ncbi:hypothetical protein ABPG72_003577 [Tetrahymena utriculariae]
MIQEAPLLNRKIIVVKDKYPRVYKLNENSLSPKQNMQEIRKSSSQEQLQSQFFAYVQRKSDPLKNKQKNYFYLHLNQSYNQNYKNNSTPKIPSQQLPLPLLNIKNKLKRYEEDSLSSSEIAQHVLEHFKSQKKRNNKMGAKDQIILPRIYNLKDIKKNGQELMNFQQVDYSFLNKKSVFGFHDQSFQDSYRHNTTTLQDEYNEEKSQSNQIASPKKDNSRSLTNNNNSNFYFSSNSNSFKNQNNSVISQLKKDSLLLVNYMEQKSIRAKNIAEINYQLKQLKKKKIHS